MRQPSIFINKEKTLVIKNGPKAQRTAAAIQAITPISSVVAAKEIVFVDYHFGEADVNINRKKTLKLVGESA